MYWQGCWLCLYLFMRGDLVNRERIKKFVGGQAVIEGVMMRGPGYTATAVREPAGTIVVQKEATKSIADTYPLVMGNEGQGISQEMAESADQLVHISMPGQAESLNVAVAAGILMFSL